MMLKRFGLLCVVKAIAVILALTMAVPTPVSAQSDLAARVKIQGSPEFGDVLLVKDGDDIILYGLANSVPPASNVTVTAGNQTFVRPASFIGKFPVFPNSPIRIIGGTQIATAEIKAVKTDNSTVTGTVSLNLTDPAIQQALLRGDMPPHILLSITAETPTDAPFVGKILLTQRLIGTPTNGVILDEFEGISESGFADAANEIRSVTPFSSIEVFREPVDASTPADVMRTKRVYEISTEIYFGGAFVSNGSFFPFTISNGTSFNKVEDTPVLYFRIISRLDKGTNGKSPKIFFAHTNNDVSAGIEGDITVINNNQANAEAPGTKGIAVVKGKADPYSLVAGFVSGTTEADVSVRADAAGTFTMVIPSKTASKDFDPNELYLPFQKANLVITDPFGNISDPQEVVLDTESVVFQGPTVTDKKDGTFQIEGIAEPLAIILVLGRNQDGQVNYFLGKSKAANDGSFGLTVGNAYDFVVQVVDQAGNVKETLAAAKRSALNPSNLSAVADFPNIKISGTADKKANVIVYAFPLNQVPATVTTSDTFPVNAFFLNATVADDNGNFAVFVPTGVSRIVYLFAIDPVGNKSQYVGFDLVDAQGKPITEGLAAFDSITVINNRPGIPDIVRARVINPITGLPLSGISVSSFLKASSDPSETFPFLEELSKKVDVNNDGTFQLSIPDRSPLSRSLFTSFYMVATEDVVDQDTGIEYRRVLGFKQIGLEDNFDRVGPEIVLAPYSSDIQLLQKGRGSDDIMNVLRVQPAGSGAGADELPVDALPLILVLADRLDRAQIDVNSIDVIILGAAPLNSIFGVAVPLAGAYGIDIGDNYWDPTTRSVVGHKNIFVALIDAAGNLSPNPMLVELDVSVNDPNPAKIIAQGNAVVGLESAVKTNAWVSIFQKPDKTGLIATTQADLNGSFNVSGLSISNDVIYVAATDTAGNVSNPIEVTVKEPVQPTQFLILDGMGGIHTPSGLVASEQSSTVQAAALTQADDNKSLLFKLQTDGQIIKIGEGGFAPLQTDQIIINNQYTRDLVVIKSNPFAGYVLLGNGVIITYGNVPFFGDIAQIQKGINVPFRKRLAGTVLFDDANNNGTWDTEDLNGNDKLDVVVGLGGVIIYNEDVNKNGKLDSENKFDAGDVSQGFAWDIARDLEVVKDANGEVKGYVILDGFGIMWPFGSGYGEEILRPEKTTGFATTDIFRAFRLIVDKGKIVDFITLNGFSNLYGSPGGLLGAGSTTDAGSTGLLTNVLKTQIFDFDIARDIQLNPIDSNNDGVIDWKDGFYILDGYGGIHAIGGAPALKGAPFLGFDIARDLLFGKQPVR